MWEWKTSGSTAPSKKDSGAVWLKKREENEDYFTSKNISNKSKQQSHSWVTVVCTGHLAKSKQLPRALSAKNANHLQTTDTIKRHQRYSIHYHCGWPSLGIWGSATHYGLPALPEPLLRARGLHRVCTGTINQNSRATLACPWFAQGISPNQNSFQGHYPQRMPIIYKPRTR